VIIIKLTQGKYAEICDEDADLADVKWNAQKRKKTWYVRRTDHSSGKDKTIKMHRVILSRKLGRELLPEEQVDHVDHNGLNNCRENLRLATNTENQHNQLKQNRKTTSKYKGVSRDETTQKWRAYIHVNGRQIYLGLFEREEDARDAYIAAAIKYFGPFAYTDVDTGAKIESTSIYPTFQSRIVEQVAFPGGVERKIEIDASLV